MPSSISVKTAANGGLFPPSFGPWHTIYVRINRRAKNGVLERIFRALQEEHLTNNRITVIQRIKFLTSNTIENYEKHKTLNTKQKQILYNQRTSWIFFSPSKLLALFLKNSMAKEDLSASDNTVKVWARHREDIIRLYGWVEERHRIFRFYRPNNDPGESSLFINQNGILYIVQEFEKYFFERHIQKIKNIENKVDGNNYQVANNFESLLKACLKIKLRKAQIKNKAENKEINEDAIFNGVLRDLLKDLTYAYKKYRRKQYKQESRNWNQKLLGILLQDNRNPLISHDEQSLLIYFVNKCCQEIYQHFSTYWKRA
jgi:hypothetical protein